MLGSLQLTFDTISPQHLLRRHQFSLVQSTGVQSLLVFKQSNSLLPFLCHFTWSCKVGKRCWCRSWREAATNATAVPRHLTAFEDYCGRYLKQALVASKGWETLPISLPTWPLARPAPTAIPKCPHFWTVVPLSPQLLLKKKQCLSNPGWYHYQVAQGLATFPHLKRELFRSLTEKEMILPTFTVWSTDPVTT